MSDPKPPISGPQDHEGEELLDSGDQSIPRMEKPPTEDDVARGLHNNASRGEGLSKSDHEFLAGYHYRKAKAFKDEPSPYDGMEDQ